ncbi:uncharacterized protein LOC109133660 [Beta vulgaris subsp. vulgaris]|uniref:uncharacterized protein LOC109133660 n=1 Tax=Beta vulgaris subsp. vulgaris TaxID=3555 RepID=UPI002036FB25|nr:uncharacterized protein LOC109133660 [Beta vulgaris subsp. vulgaris]
MGGKFEVGCPHKCDCEWNIKRGKFVHCHCPKDHLRCLFKVRAVKSLMSDQYQLRECQLKHDCGFYHHSNKITSAYLAERYIDDWKADPRWSLKAFIDKVYRDLGLTIGYSKAWFTRARVKQILYGDGDKQYAKVYQYAFALLKYNRGSTAIVVVENNEHTSSPHFARMNDSLCNCKGWKKNNIFPVAWAIVEVENTTSWTWCLELLMNDTGHIDGDGLTLMSDRQKGLIEAISITAPKADVRFCVRHIWANFKKKFAGTLFKEAFWKAAKATTLVRYWKPYNTLL